MKLVIAAALLALLGGQAAAQTQCPDHVKVTRSNGTWKAFLGHDPADPWVCVGIESGKPIKSILNIWGVGAVFPDPGAIRVQGGVEELKAQIGAVIAGPPGTRGRWFRLDTALSYFDVPSFTLVHEADEVLTVQGQPHYTFRLRLIGSGAGRSGFDTTMWFDRSLLIALRKRSDGARGDYDVVSIDRN